ncbi:MAG: hypothetical protein EA422_12690 [Gemmatimonadales bacterium]|nr:MAG: hypothetical protein EA422_12690 [Gemmatimonadales bacterium]
MSRSFPCLPGLGTGAVRKAAGSVLLFSLLVGAAACSDPAIPEGTPGDIEARVFVDVNATGSFVAGDDEPVAGVGVELLTPTGDLVDSGTTDPDGLVRFNGLRPSGYELRQVGSGPEGAVLATSRTPSVRVPAQGGVQEVDFRYVFNPGSAAGVVFRDDTGTGSFDPDGDFPGEGTRLLLYRGASATGEADLEAVTDASGAFAFPRLRPGPWTLRIELPPPLELVGDPVRSFTVNPMAETRLEILFEGDQVIDIAEARTLDLGTIVTVQGVVTVDRGNFGNLDVHVQDGTGGIDVFLGGTSGVPALVAGDSVEVTGALGDFNDALQIRSPSSVEVLGTGELPDPRAVTGQEVEARTFEGLVATLGVVTVEDIEVQNFDNHNLQVRTADGMLVEVRVDSRTGLSSSDWEVGGSYEIVGILRVRNGVPRLQPRSPADRIIPAEPVAIADARAAEDGETVTVVGVVVVDQGIYDFNKRDTYIQDSSGGLRLWELDSALELREGEEVRVSGTMSTFRQERQLDASSVLRVGTAEVPEPREVTGAGVFGLEFDGELARVIGPVTVVSVQVFGFDAHNVTVVAEDGAEFVVRMDSPNEIPSDYWEEGAQYQVTGVLARFNQVGQIKPRGFRDVIEP